MSASKLIRLGRYLTAILLSMFAQAALAQTSNMVLLQSLDNSVAVSGELVAAKDGQYQLSTIAGVITMDIDIVRCTGAACPMVVHDFDRNAEVKLISDDGAVDITGYITDIVDDHYVVDNAVLGSMRIRTDVVECSGPGCPSGLRFADEATIEATTIAATEEVEASTTAAPATEVEAEATPATPVVNVEAETTPVAETGSSGPDTARVSFAGSDTVGIGLLPYLMEDYVRSRQAMQQLNEIGIEFAMDDFGTGYSSLLRLKEMPLSLLKIDQTFVKTMMTSTNDAAIVDASVRLGHAIGMTVIAEGIETAEQAEALRKLDCERGQGYYFSMPLSPDEIDFTPQCRRFAA